MASAHDVKTPYAMGGHRGGGPIRLETTSCARYSGSSGWNKALVLGHCLLLSTSALWVSSARSLSTSGDGRQRRVMWGGGSENVGPDVPGYLRLIEYPRTRARKRIGGGDAEMPFLFPELLASLFTTG